MNSIKQGIAVVQSVGGSGATILDRFIDNITEINAVLDGFQYVVRFPNGYGASIVQHNYSYGGKEGLVELAVAKFISQDSDSWVIDYDTPITDDVLGYLNAEEVGETLDSIQSLQGEEYVITSSEGYWSNEQGWVSSISQASHFSREESETLPLPIGASAEWERIYSF